MVAGDCWSAGVLAGFVSGGEVATPALRATMKNTGASTSAATERRRLVAVPLRTRRNDTIAGIIVTKHSRAPNGVVAGITASSAPRTAMTNVTAPRPLLGDADWSAFIGMYPFPVGTHPLVDLRDPVLRRRVEYWRSSGGRHVAELHRRLRVPGRVLVAQEINLLDGGGAQDPAKS
jgi:hypothetical protein